MRCAANALAFEQARNSVKQTSRTEMIRKKEERTIDAPRVPTSLSFLKTSEVRSVSPRYYLTRTRRYLYSGTIFNIPGC